MNLSFADNVKQKTHLNLFTICANLQISSLLNYRKLRIRSPRGKRLYILTSFFMIVWLIVVKLAMP